MTTISPILRRNANTAKLNAEIGTVDYSDALGGKTNIIVDGIAFVVTTVDMTIGFVKYDIAVKDALTAKFNHVHGIDVFIAAFTDGPKDLTDHLAAIHDNLGATALISVESQDFLVWDTPVNTTCSKVKRVAKIAALTVAAGAVSFGVGFATYKWFNK